ncbi:MAG TPA: hypothetical protein VHS09_08240 [Polyangiaceae bacterium]|nr:hypothetical protein [Polyangiaceae bacterium]
MKASIRLVFVVAVLVLTSLSAGCAAGTPLPYTAPRVVRERLVLADEEIARSSGSLAVAPSHRVERAGAAFARRIVTPR